MYEVPSVGLVRTFVGVVLVVAAQLVGAQEAVSDASLRGTWMVGGSRLDESFTFAPDGEFYYAYTQRKKDGKDIPPITVRSEGAYKVAAGACSAGSEKGNIWVVRNSDRCCFNAYVMSKTLVLDEVKGGGLASNLLCQSKTLKREANAVGATPKK